MNGILIIAHAPLASALRTCALHVFPDSEAAIGALDIQPNVPPEESLAQAQALLRQAGWPSTLILTDVFGATARRVTIELSAGGVIVQKRGLANRQPRADEEAVISRWASQFNLENRSRW